MMQEILWLMVKLEDWVTSNPDAVAGDMAGENLLTLVRQAGPLLNDYVEYGCDVF